MDSFDDKIAVITGGGTGMGREIARQLAESGCHIAMCDVSEENMAKTRALCQASASPATKISCHLADVSSEQQMIDFRSQVMEEHQTDCVHLVFNNAGIGGTGSLISDERASWERTFDVCWYGVYYGTRTFIPLLVAAEEARLVNTSSMNGFWASAGPEYSHSAYSAAKFAVKGFSEALINDFRLNAPHVGVSLVMPGHIGTSIEINSSKLLGQDPKEMSDEEVEQVRERLLVSGLDVAEKTIDEIRRFLVESGESFRDDAPMTAEEAASIILDGVRQRKWRILVGEDAKLIDRLVREDPENAYSLDFMARIGG